MLVLLALALILFAVSLVFIFFGFRGKHKSEPAIKNSPSTQRSEPKDRAAIKKESELDGLLLRFKKLKEDHQRLEAELIESNKSKAAALAEAEKINAWVEKSKGLLEEAKNEMLEFKERLAQKDLDYEREFSRNLNLSRELSDYRERQEQLEKVKQQLADKLRLLEAQNKGYQEEINKLNRLITDLRKRGSETEWVSKKEYDALKERLNKIMESDT